MNAKKDMLKSIKIKEALDLMKTKKVFLLDVRAYTELMNGYIEGFQQLSFSQLEKKVTDDPEWIPNNSKIIIICSNGQRSKLAAELLISHGYQHVMYVEEGMKSIKDIPDLKLSYPSTYYPYNDN